MKRLLRAATVAFAFTNLYLLFLTGPLISPEHQLIFHLSGSATAIFAPVMVDLFVATFVVTGLLLWVGRFPRAELALWAALLLPLPFNFLWTVAGFSGRPAPQWLFWTAGVGALAGWLWVLLRARFLVPRFRRHYRALLTLFSFMALSGVLIVTQLLWAWWRARDLNPPFAARVVVTTAAAPRAATPRVLWIIFDELSFRQVYGHRATGLELPNFDRFAAEATIFPHAEATAQYTRYAIPSLLTGEEVSSTQPGTDGKRLRMHRVSGGWTLFNPKDTVFADAQRADLPTAVDGWYEPYCRILRPVLDRCFWTYSDNLAGDLSPQASVTANALRIPREAGLRLAQLAGLSEGMPPEGTLDVERHRDDYQALVAAGDNMLRTGSAGLILLHLPVPHPWGFYDRHTGSFPEHRTSYLDNLALADLYLGHLRSLLEAQGVWDDTDVIIMGDHGWRARSVWMHSGFWLPEEAQAVQGAEAVDAPAVMVKLRGQHTAAVTPTRFNAVRTRSLIDVLLRRQLQTPGDLERWLRGSAGPPAAGR